MDFEQTGLDKNLQKPYELMRQYYNEYYNPQHHMYFGKNGDSVAGNLLVRALNILDQSRALTDMNEDRAFVIQAASLLGHYSASFFDRETLDGLALDENYPGVTDEIIRIGEEISTYDEAAKNHPLSSEAILVMKGGAAAAMDTFREGCYTRSLEETVKNMVQDFVNRYSRLRLCEAHPELDDRFYTAFRAYRSAYLAKMKGPGFAPG